MNRQRLQAGVLLVALDSCWLLSWAVFNYPKNVQGATSRYIDAQSGPKLLYSASRICDLRFEVGFGSLPVYDMSIFIFTKDILATTKHEILMIYQGHTT
jgi:hypothetical protein